jgi:hypothetical protein
MPDQEIASFVLKPTGDFALAPIPKGPEAKEYRVVIEGELHFAHTDETFDAVYTMPQDGAFMHRHDYLRWSVPVTLESEDATRHRYVFKVPATQNMAGQSIGVQVDVDKFVNDFLLPPSEIRKMLSGEMRVTVSQVLLPPVSPWPMIGWAAVPVLALAGGVGVVIRRRMALRGLSPDLQNHLGSIEQKFRTACAALTRKPAGDAPLQDRLTAVKAGAAQLIRQIQDLRNTQRLVDRPAIESQVLRLERHLSTLSDTAAKREGEMALTEKRKALTLLDDLQRAEHRAALRLTKIEAVLDTTCLTLRNLPKNESSVPAEETLREELEAEVAAIQEVARDMASYEVQQVQRLGQAH